MAVEAYLNFFGVTCLGEKEFGRFERRGPERKLETLFLECAELSLKPTDEIRLVVRRIARRRNALVHPETCEVDSPRGLEVAQGMPFSESVDEAAQDMVQFFKLFGDAVPEAQAHFTSLDLTDV
jgi:hypothetical protein